MAGLLALAVIAWLCDPRSAPTRPAVVRWLLAVLALSVLLDAPVPPLVRPGRARARRRRRGPRVRRLAARRGCCCSGRCSCSSRSRSSAGCSATRRPGRNAVWIAVAALFAGSLLAAAEWAHVALLAALLLVALQALLAAGHAAGPAARLAARGRRLRLPARPGDPVHPGRVRRQPAVPDEHGVQARLPGVAAARASARSARSPGGASGSRAGSRAGRTRSWRSRSSSPRPCTRWWAPTRARARFEASPTLDGLGWLRDRAPGDPGAIAWLNDHAPDDAVVLEAVGEDYSAFGHGRISTFTGLPTVLGWPGHERQWGHDVGTRADEVEQAYTATTAEEAAPVLRAPRRALRRGGPARADRLRRRRDREVGRARAARVRRGRHGGVGVAVTREGCGPAGVAVLASR